MIRPTTCASALAVLAGLSGCQSPLVGTWIETSDSSPQATAESKRAADEANLLVFRSDGTTVDQTIRDRRFASSIPATYRVKRDILIIEAGMGCIHLEAAERFTIEGDTLVLDDGTFRTTYQRLRQPTCLGITPR